MHFGPRRPSARHPVTLDVRQKNMTAANIDFESDTVRQEIWRSAMTDRTTVALQAEYPETGFTATVALDRRALGHRNNRFFRRICEDLRELEALVE